MKIVLAREKEYMEMTFKLKLEDQKSVFDRQRRELERKHQIEGKQMKEELEAIRRENNALKTDFYRQENHDRLLEQKIRQEEKNKQTQVEFSNTLCNVSFFCFF